MTSERDRIDEIQRSLHRIEGALFGGGDQDKGFVQLTRERLKSHGDRVLRLEIVAATLTGALGVAIWMLTHADMLQAMTGHR